MTVEAVSSVIADDRVSEIVILDDCSTDGSLQKLVEHYVDNIKVKVYKNKENIDCYRNKHKAISFASNNWCILLDSDNIIDKTYLDTLYQFEWVFGTAYLPVYAKPHFDYRKFEGRAFNKTNVREVIQDTTFQTALNTANFFVDKQSYCKAFDETVDPHTSDSIYMNYRLLKQGCTLVLVPGLHYQHRVHNGSHYVANNHKTKNFHQEVLNKLNQLC